MDWSPQVWFLGNYLHCSQSPRYSNQIHSPTETKTHGTHWFHGLPLVRIRLYFPFQKFSVKIYNFVPDAFQGTTVKPGPNEEKKTFGHVSNVYGWIFYAFLIVVECNVKRDLGTK